jgi:hypothetical protein
MFFVAKQSIRIKGGVEERYAQRLASIAGHTA